MKKHLFSFMMMLALVVLAGTSAFAQPGGNGQTPATASLFAAGSTGKFTVTKSTSTNFIAWDLYTHAANAPQGTAGSAITEGDGAANGLDFVAALGSSTTANPDAADDAATASCFVKFYAEPAAGNVWIIQATEYEGADANIDDAECVSIRRIYVNVFDYNVDIFFCDALGDTTNAPFTGTSHDGNIQVRNNWHNSILSNYLTSAALNTNDVMHRDTVNNPVDNIGKADTIYFGVEMAITGLDASYDLNNIDWRFDYSLVSNSFDINKIVALGLDDAANGQPTFNGDVDEIWGDEETETDENKVILSFPSDADYTANNSVTVPLVTSATAATDNKQNSQYVFMVILNKDFPETEDNTIQLQVDQVQLRMGGADFNDGTKEFASAGGDPDLKDGQTGTYTIYASPSPSIISIER